MSPLYERPGAAMERLRAERDVYRFALERIASHFVDLPNGTTKTYAGPIGTLDLIRREVREAVGAAAAVSVHRSGSER